MLRNIQERIILIFLIVGVLIIGAIGYINYQGIQNIQESGTQDIEKYRNYDARIW